MPFHCFMHPRGIQVIRETPLLRWDFFLAYAEFCGTPLLCFLNTWLTGSLRDAALAHPCARGVPAILAIKKAKLLGFAFLFRAGL